MAGELIEKGRSLWKDRALFVQIQIRNRFRVAVDRHRHRKLDLDYSQTICRWIQKLWPDPGSHPSKTRASYRFYRKRVGKVVDGVDDSAIVRMMQAVAVPVIGSACHVFMHGLNHVKVYGAEKLHQALLKRPKGKPLLTVSNHVAAIDDPFVIASLLPPNIMLDAHNLRWTLCATDRCFSNPVLSAFFRCVKVLPVSRGDGIYQKGMDMALSKLNSGGWVHIFPEGSRSRDGGKTVSSAKRGVGRLVMDADSIPVVIPFVHTGMQEIMPVGTKFPKVGKQVTVVVGDPIYLDDLLVSKDTTQDDSRGILYDIVSSRIGHHLQMLKVQAEKFALEQQFDVQQYHMNDGEHGYGIWQQVDWEAFGMENVMSSSEDNGSQTVKQALLDQPMEERSHEPSSTNRMGFSYEGGIMSRVRYYVNPSEFMGFAARGLFMNSQLLDEGLGHFNIQEARPVRAWKQFVNERLTDGGFSIQEAHPVRAWKQFMHERVSDEGRSSIQEAGPVRAWKQFMNERLPDEGCFSIQEAGPVRGWKQFMNERFSDEGCFSIQEAGPVKAWKQFMTERKQFFEGTVYELCNSMQSSPVILTKRACDVR